MLQVDVSASTRDSFGKCAMRRLRLSGNTPAVLYGNDKDTVALQIETKPLLKSLFQINRKNAIVNLSINGEDTRHVMMREIQTDPVDDSLIHADFFEVNLQAPTTFIVPIEFTGTAKGSDLGGVLICHNSTIQVEGLPLEVPDNVSVDISDLAIGDSIAYSVVELPANVKMLSNASDLCVAVVDASEVYVPPVEEEEIPEVAEAADGAETDEVSTDTE
jgi:large subunit ribosomal protein L25